MDILNQILSAVSVKLDALYPDVKIFVEEIPQCLPTRYFILNIAGSSEIAQELDERYRVSGTVDIAYFVPRHSPSLQQEYNRVFARVALELRRVSFGSLRLLLHGHRRQDVDDVLHILAQFETHLYRVDHTPMIGGVGVDKMEAK